MPLTCSVLPYLTKAATLDSAQARQTRQNTGGVAEG